MNSKVIVSDIKAYRRYLARCDEFLKAYKFINAASKLYPELQEEAELAFKQVGHIYDKRLYDKYYSEANTELPMPLELIYNDSVFPDRLRWVKRLMVEQKPKSILDLGCSEGSYSLNLAHAGYNVVGVNLYKSSIDTATERAKTLKLDDRAKFVQADVIDYDEGTKFDAVLLFEIIEHVADPQGLIDKSIGLLNEGGILYISTPDGTADEKSTALGVDLENAAGGEFKGHVRVYTKETLAKLFRGLEIVDFYLSETDSMRLLHYAVKKGGKHG
jgi:2-polyprenyl-3-methyl-5-hydroxy-6-metoxy-1,4-benzoquinol methylase